MEGDPFKMDVYQKLWREELEPSLQAAAARKSREKSHRGGNFLIRRGGETGTATQ